MTEATERFDRYFKDVHATQLLTEREKMFIGPTPASQVRGKQASPRRPWTRSWPS